jgi:hypothetical protein
LHENGIKYLFPDLLAESKSGFLYTFGTNPHEENAKEEGYDLID